MFISLIIPVFNTEEVFLRQCIESCVNQNISKSEYEIICVNDGSKHDCLEIISEYKKNNSNLILLSQDNSGVSVARNNGILHAKGDYIWFVDSDDFILENSLKELRELIYRNPVDRMNLGAYHFVNSLNTVRKDIKPNHALRSIFCTRSLYNRLFLIHHNIAFHPKLTLGEDMLFNFELDQIEHTEDNINTVYYFYRINESSLTHRNKKSNAYAVKFIENHLLACRIVKSYYDSVPKITTVRYLHVDIAQMMVYISGLQFSCAKKYLIKIRKSKIFPYLKNWFAIGFLAGVYTNVHSLFLNTICCVASWRLLFFVIKLWTVLWNSKTKKKIEKIIKQKIK